LSKHLAVIAVAYLTFANYHVCLFYVILSNNLK